MRLCYYVFGTAPSPRSDGPKFLPLALRDRGGTEGPTQDPEGGGRGLYGVIYNIIRARPPLRNRTLTPLKVSGSFPGSLVVTTLRHS